jgi:flavin reductase (DIM6/NTAB) family NADH-FMN oxidoreductase RutF
MVLVCLHREADAHDPLLQAGHFGVSILTDHQDDLALRFSRDDPDERFPGLEVVEGPLGSPLVRGALAWMECRIREVHAGGDHSIVLGEVEECVAHDGEPLLFFRGTLTGLSS